MQYINRYNFYEHWVQTARRLVVPINTMLRNIVMLLEDDSRSSHTTCCYLCGQGEVGLDFFNIFLKFKIAIA